MTDAEKVALDALEAHGWKNVNDLGEKLKNVAAYWPEVVRALRYRAQSGSCCTRIGPVNPYNGRAERHSGSCVAAFLLECVDPEWAETETQRINALIEAAQAESERFTAVSGQSTA